MNTDEADDSWPEIWRRVIDGADAKNWVVFENGTCVIVVGPTDDVSKRAIEILREHGPVHSGSPAGDFSVIPMTDDSGWIVTCHHPDVLNFVENLAAPPNDAVVGLVGRQCRAEDAQALKIIHVEIHRT